VKRGVELGYDEADFQRLRELGCELLESPEELERVVDQYGYLDDWRSHYQICSVRRSLHNTRITCIDSAVFTYGLLELLFPHVKRRLLAIHRRAPATGEECGHCVTLYWDHRGRVGSFSKSNFDALGHRGAMFGSECEVAESYAKAYLSMGFEPLYFGVTTLEAVAPDIDWRFDPNPVNVLSERIQSSYEYDFVTAS
jgi:hypothetical protein